MSNHSFKARRQNMTSITKKVNHGTLGTQREKIKIKSFPLYPLCSQW